MGKTRRTYSKSISTILKRHFFILIPSLISTGPVKGAIALANALVHTRKVTLISLKGGSWLNNHLSEEIQYISLENTFGGIIGKIKYYRKILRRAGGKSRVASVSMCFSADIVNVFCRKYALSCSSVRANLIENYKMDYGITGYALAVLHYYALNFFDHVVVMTQAMSEQVKKYLFKKPTTIGNFVDEESLNIYRDLSDPDNVTRYVFLGSLTERKQPLLLVKSIATLRERGLQVNMDIIGQGPLMKKILSEIQRFKMQNIIHVHGQLENPYNLVAKANILVLPSLSEGVSRAALEALYLGVPCLLRNVDGNKEIIISGYNGFLFESDDDLPDAMLKIYNLINGQRKILKSLIPHKFRQSNAARCYIELLE